MVTIVLLLSFGPLVYKSTDGIIFTNVADLTSSIGGNPFHMIFDGSKFLACGTGIAYSYNGVTWKKCRLD